MSHLPTLTETVNLRHILGFLKSWTISQGRKHLWLLVRILPMSALHLLLGNHHVCDRAVILHQRPRFNFCPVTLERSVRANRSISTHFSLRVKSSIIAVIFPAPFLVCKHRTKFQVGDSRVNCDSSPSSASLHSGWTHLDEAPLGRIEPGSLTVSWGHHTAPKLLVSKPYLKCKRVIFSFKKIIAVI